MITREIEERSIFFEGQPPKDWELIGVVENRKNRLFYYLDKQGRYHHTAVPLKSRYNPFEIRLHEKDGMKFARMELKKLKKQQFFAQSKRP